ncbi:hypothetical protein CAPTEDRAFT_154852 [Capitella teleta]|uniref:MITD1 C-terminal phospholipase D-like domain-containing protein n=1 Tax=Capitella teleta TaxID=283909 RepID=R7VLZ5_CAPTE|nr:hypothetical protein CAPTEDRAFT_154852 [Capitella teleta]|eukprot:ELU18070.1 hypothetical protein CAPTEDRAFT_154852 [Capitella teleta]
MPRRKGSKTKNRKSRKKKPDDDLIPGQLLTNNDYTLNPDDALNELREEEKVKAALKILQSEYDSRLKSLPSQKLEASDSASLGLDTFTRDLFELVDKHVPGHPRSAIDDIQIDNTSSTEPPVSTPVRSPEDDLPLNVHQEPIIHIAEDSTGHDYSQVLETVLQYWCSEVAVEDPYIQVGSQLENFEHLCEVLIESNIGIEVIHLKTCAADMKNRDNQKKKLTSLIDQLHKMHNVKLQIQEENKSSLHDREIKFENGFEVILGRGLDYFLKRTMAIEFDDWNERKCRKCSVTISIAKELIPLLKEKGINQ